MSYFCMEAEQDRDSFRLEEMYATSYQPMSKHSDTQSVSQGQQDHCANCDIEILWLPTVVQGSSYCCTGCAAGGPCNCDYSQYSTVSAKGASRNDTDAGATEIHAP